jgi:hypothetical protein
VVLGAAAAYGGAVVQRAADQTADASVDAAVGLGGRILRLLSRSSRSTQVEEAVTDLADDPQNDDLAAAVRVQVRKALTEDPELAAELARLLGDAGHRTSTFNVKVSGAQGVQIGDRNTQTNTFNTPPSG